MRRIIPNKHILILLFSFSSLVLNAQNTTLKGKITDQSSNTGIANAVVMVLSEKDSILKSFVRTAPDGTFNLRNVPTGKNILMISHPLYAEYVDNISVDFENSPLKLTLVNKSKLLETIIIKTGGAIKIKGDTTIYTADSFNVSANANVEELLKKLPGIQVDKNGEIKAMGEKVEKVLVDGEEFFGDDPGMAVKNIRADAVKEVQVFDKKSEQAAFTGIDDGNTQKTINLKLKEDKKKGYFGKISLSGGIANEVNSRFNNNLLFGSFKGKRKISLYTLNGNTGQDGLNWQDRMKYGSSEENNFEMWDEDGIFSFSFTNNNNDEEVNINTENGFLRNVNSGLNYSNKWLDKHSLNLSPKYDEQDYSNVKQTLSITQLGDSSLTQKSNTQTNLNRYSLKNSAIYDFKIDSANSFKLTLKTNYFHTDSREVTDGETSGETGTLKNSSNRDSKINSDKTQIYGNLIFKHKFNKDRRTLTLNTDWNQLQTSSDNYLKSNNTAYVFDTSFTLNIDQLSKNEKNSQKLSSKINYTEPLSKRWSAELSYELSLNNASNNQNTYTPSSGGNVYNIQVDSLTNDFKQKIIVHTPAAKFNYNFKKIKFNFGSGFGITAFDLLDRSRNKDYLRNYINLFPNATFVYTYKGNHSLRVRYNGYNTQPTINQLQPLTNNTDLFNQFLGNPDLKPSFTNNFNITHNGYNFLKEIWNFQSFNLNLTENAITYNRIIDASTGATVSKPINTNGNTSATLWTGMGFKLKKLKTDMEVNANANYSRFSDVINNLNSFSNTTSGGMGLTLRKSKTDKYDFSFNNNFNISYNNNSQTKSTNTFRSNDANLNAKVYIKKVWSVSTDYLLTLRQKLEGQTDNLNVNIWNAQLERTFRNNEFTIFIRARDILNQNTGINRYYFGNNFTEETNQRLKRYFMVGFSWDFKNKNEAPKK